MNKCIRMGITVFKFVIWGGKAEILLSQLTFYGSANTLLWKEMSDRKTANLPPQMTNLNADIP